MPSNHLILLSPSPPAFNVSQHQGLLGTQANNPGRLPKVTVGKIREMLLGNGPICDSEIVPVEALELLGLGSFHRLCVEQMTAWQPIWSLREEKALLPIPIWGEKGP